MDGESFRILFIRRGVERGLAWMDNERVVNSVVKAVVSQWLLPFVPDNEAPIPLTNFLSRAAKARGPIRSFPGTNHAIAGPATYIRCARECLCAGCGEPLVLMFHRQKPVPQTPGIDRIDPTSLHARYPPDFVPFTNQPATEMNPSFRVACFVNVIQEEYII